MVLMHVLVTVSNWCTSFLIIVLSCYVLISGAFNFTQACLTFFWDIDCNTMFVCNFTRLHYCDTLYHICTSIAALAVS